ncbi:hypothetical protein V8E36_002429 [Tilletia maclaganii]
MRALARRARNSVRQWWRNREPRTRRIIVLLAVIYAAIAITVLLIGPHKIFKFIAGIAIWLATQPYGILISLAVIVLTSIPPIPGYGLGITLCGLSFGSRAAGPDFSVWKGWLVAASGCLLGSAVAFGVLRTVMRYFAEDRRVQDLKEHRNWRAMEAAIRQKGIPIVILLRLAPFPFCYSNLFFASMQSVSFPAFMLATLCITPKLLLHVFVGSKAFDLLNNENGTLPLHVRILNYVYIVVGSVVGWATGHYLWKTTQGILANFEQSERLEAGRARPVGASANGAGGASVANPAGHSQPIAFERDADPDLRSGERSPLLGST